MLRCLGRLTLRRDYSIFKTGDGVQLRQNWNLELRVITMQTLQCL